MRSCCLYTSTGMLCASQGLSAEGTSCSLADWLGVVTMTLCEQSYCSCLTLKGRAAGEGGGQGRREEGGSRLGGGGEAASSYLTVEAKGGRGLGVGDAGSYLALEGRGGRGVELGKGGRAGQMRCASGTMQGQSREG